MLLVPIWSSILLLLHRLQAKRPGVITIQAPSLTRVHLETIDAHPATPCEGVSSRRAVHRTLLQDRTELAPVDVQTLEQATQVVVHHIVSMLHRRMASLSVGQGAGA